MTRTVTTQTTTDPSASRSKAHLRREAAPLAAWIRMDSSPNTTKWWANVAKAG